MKGMYDFMNFQEDDDGKSIMSEYKRKKINF